MNANVLKPDNGSQESKSTKMEFEQYKNEEQRYLEHVKTNQNNEDEEEEDV